MQEYANTCASPSPTVDPAIHKLQVKLEQAHRNLDHEWHRQEAVRLDKTLRGDIDTIVQRLRAQATHTSDERQSAIHYLLIGIMWLGMDLKALGEANPYPNSRDASNIVVDPTADGLKL